MKRTVAALKRSVVFAKDIAKTTEVFKLKGDGSSVGAVACPCPGRPYGVTTR